MFDAQHGAISITPTSASILSMELAGADNIVKQLVYLPPEVKEAVYLPAGTVLGTVSAVGLATMDDPLVKATIEEGDEVKTAWKAEATANGAKAKELQQEIYSIMSEENNRAKGGKQTAIRYKPQTALPPHDIREAKTGKELVEIWEM